MHIYILNRNCINLKSLRVYIISFFIILFQELKTNIIDIYYHSFTHSQLTLVFNSFYVWWHALFYHLPCTARPFLYVRMRTILCSFVPAYEQV